MLKQQGNERMQALQSNLSSGGFGRSSVAIERKDKILAETQRQIAMEEALMNERIAKLKAEQEGQSAEFIK
jgi:hypothetical protein